MVFAKIMKSCLRTNCWEFWQIRLTLTKYVAKILIFRKIGKHHSQENLGKQIFGREIEFRRHRATTVQSGKEKSVEYVNNI